MPRDARAPSAPPGQLLGIFARWVASCSSMAAGVLLGCCGRVSRRARRWGGRGSGWRALLNVFGVLEAG